MSAVAAHKALAAECHQHGRGEAWLVCVHATADNSDPVLLPSDRNFTGECICDACAASGDVATDDLKTACGACVRQIWGHPGEVN